MKILRQTGGARLTAPAGMTLIGNRIRSCLAGSFALGSAYAVSMPQIATADIINISSFFDFVQADPRTYDPQNNPGNAVDFTSHVFVNGIISTHNVLILLTKDFPEYDAYAIPIGGFNLLADSSTASGFISSYEGNWLGLSSVDNANTPLSFSGDWRVYEDVDGDGYFGTYDTDTGLFTFERLLAHTDPNAPTDGRITVYGFDNFQGSGAYTQGVFDISSQSPTTMSFNNGALSVSGMTVGCTNWLESCTDLNGTWSTVLVWTATGTATNIPFTTTNVTEFIRAGFFR